MNTQFTYLPYLVFFGGLLIIALICLLSQLTRHIPDAELQGELPPPEGERSDYEKAVVESNALDPRNWPTPITWQERASLLIETQREELL